MRVREEFLDLENIELEGLNPYEIALLLYSNPPVLNFEEPATFLYAKEWLAWPVAVVTNLRYYEFESQDLLSFLGIVRPEDWPVYRSDRDAVWHATRELCFYLETHTEGARPIDLSPLDFSLSVAQLGRASYFESLENLEKKGLAIDPFGFGVGEAAVTLFVIGILPVDFLHETPKGGKVKTRIKTILFEYEHERIKNTNKQKTSFRLNAKVVKMLERLIPEMLS